MYSDLNEIFFSDTKKNKTKQIDYPIRKKRKKYKTKQNIQYIEKSNHQKSLILQKIMFYEKCYFGDGSFV